jgi:hypothetical protein
MSTYRVTTEDTETVTMPVPVTVELTAVEWKVERNGRWLGTVAVDIGGKWRAFWFNAGTANGGDGSYHATRDEAVAAVVAGTDR